MKFIHEPNRIYGTDENGNVLYVPSMFVGKEKIYEARPGQQYDEIKEAVRTVFEKAIG